MFRRVASAETPPRQTAAMSAPGPHGKLRIPGSGAIKGRGSASWVEGRFERRSAQACHDPPEKKARTFHGALVATRGDFEAEVELVWTEDPEDKNLGAEIGELFVGDGRRDSELCQGPGFPPAGCSCATATSPGRWAAMAPWIVVIALTRRRRRRTP